MRQPVAVNIALQTALADLRWSCSCATTLPDFGCGLLTRLPHTCKTRKPRRHSFTRYTRSPSRSKERTFRLCLDRLREMKPRPKFLRQTFQEWALRSITYSPWARAYYDEQRAKGKGCNTAIKSLAFKWIRILFRCWREHKPYDEALHQCVLKAHRAKQERVAPYVDLRWKTVAGFSKLAIPRT